MKENTILTTYKYNERYGWPWILELFLHSPHDKPVIYLILRALRACLELILVHVYSASIPPSPAPLPQPPAQPTRRTYIEQPAWHLSSICLNELAAWVCVGVQIT